MRVEFFSAYYCSACRGVKPNVISACNDAKVPIEIVDAELNEDYCIKINISTLPTIIIFDDEGNELDRVTGTISRQEMSKRLIEAKDE